MATGTGPVHVQVNARTPGLLGERNRRVRRTRPARECVDSLRRVCRYHLVDRLYGDSIGGEVRNFLVTRFQKCIQRTLQEQLVADGMLGCRRVVGD